MASEFVLGMHGQLEYQGMRLAGMWPQIRPRGGGGRRHDLRAGGNVNTTRSVAWNVARAFTLVKPCTDEATIPVHMNAGMGVGGVPMSPIRLRRHRRGSRALVDILKLDGL